MIVANTRTLKDRVYTPTPFSITGVPVLPFETYDQVLEHIEDTIESNRKSFCVAINPIKIYNAWHTPELLDLLKHADINICDGIGVSIASRILNGRKVKRITGCDLFFKLLQRAEKKSWGVYLLGASAHSNLAARLELQKMYPDLRIVGWQDGYFDDSTKVIRKINDSEADLLFVAMGSPKQEYWLWHHRKDIDSRFCMGVGGSFDIASGSIKRAPKVFRATGTEFLYRFITEPRKRLANQKILLYFLMKIIGSRLTGAPVEWA